MSQEEEEVAEEPTVVTLDFATRRKAGLTVSNARGGPGVRVVAMVRCSSKSPTLPKVAQI